MRKKKEQAIITHVAAHDIFGNFRFFKKDNGEIWCAIPDLCKVLDLKNPTMVANRLNENEKAKFNLGYSGKPGNPNIWFANEPGLYRIIFMSKKIEAKKFQDWVYHEVLPSIRKTGTYSLPQEETVTIQVKGSKNLNAFKKNHPNIKFSEKAYLTGTYFEDGVDREETFIRYDLTLNINDYKKIEQKNSFDRLFISN